ncbi:hypothetical protein LCGC14_1563730, partial [marine sediment metagenome]
GRQLALQLAVMGAPSLTIVDFDLVEESNLASQAYLESDLGRLKVEATAEACRRINSSIALDIRNERFRRSTDVGNVVFGAVDTISCRRLIWESVKDRCDFFGDVRMTAEVIRVLTACDASGREHYPGTLFDQAEAYAGSCTSRMTIFGANIGAGLLLSRFSCWLRGLPTERDVVVNLLASEMTCQ